MTPWPRVPVGAPSRSFRRRLLTRLGWVLLGTVLLVGASGFAFVSHLEYRIWEAREQEAAGHAVQTVAEFLERTRDSLAAAALLDADALRSDPEFLKRWLERSPALQEMVRLDGQGRILGSAARDRAVLSDLFTITQSNWYQQARSGIPYVGSVEVSAAEEPYLILALPAPGAGVAALRLHLRVLWDVVDRLRFGRTGVIFFVDATGRLIAHPDRDLVLRRETLEGRPELAAALGAPAKEWHGNYLNFQGRTVHGVTAAVPGTSWVAVAELPQGEARAASRAALFLVGGGGVFFGLVAVGITVGQLRRLVFEPLDALRSGAGRIGSGDLGHRIPVVETDEVGQVARAFNDMAQRLAAREQELAAEVAERGRTAEELRTARDQAEAASRAKSEFLARMSHEIRTPMNGVLGMTELLLATGLGGKQKHYAETVRASGTALLAILNDVLDFSKIEAGKLELAEVEFDPGHVVRTAVDLFGGQAQQKGLRLVCSADPALPSGLRGDPNRLGQILNNLVSNALKFTDKGSVTVRAEAEDDDGQSVRLRISVSDTGIGIDPAHHRSIFEDFSQVASFATRRHGGTGLGLAIAKRLAEMMGGDLTVQSVPGQGSTFCFVSRLPKAPHRSHGAFRQPGLPAAAAAQGVQPPARTDGPPFPGRRVLIAEDNPTNRELAVGMLGALGCRADVAADGAQAVQAAAGTLYDLILMDCQMPEMDGYEAARRIREASAAAGPDARRVPIVALTGHAVAGEREKCLAVGMDDFLAKPYRLDQLRAVAARWLPRGA